MMLSDVLCLSVTYIGPKSRTERPRKTKIGIEVPTSHVTRTPLSRSKGQRSRSPGRFIHRGVYASGSCSGGRGNVFTVGVYTLRSAGSAARGASAPTEEGEGRGHIVAAVRLQLVVIIIFDNGQHYNIVCLSVCLSVCEQASVVLGQTLQIDSK